MGRSLKWGRGFTYFFGVEPQVDRKNEATTLETGSFISLSSPIHFSIRFFLRGWLPFKNQVIIHIQTNGRCQNEIISIIFTLNVPFCGLLIAVKVIH
jgi:hypothetical protein